jgi:hypothetical protein
MSEFKEGDQVRVTDNHAISKLRGETGHIESLIDDEFAIIKWPSQENTFEIPMGRQKISLEYVETCED